MAFFSWTRWLRSLVSPTVKPIRTRRRFVPKLEPLENRLAPAAFTWSGNGLDSKWSTDANWIGGAHPTGVSGAEDLVFPANASRKVNVNDLTNATFNLRRIDSVKPKVPDLR